MKRLYVAAATIATITTYLNYEIVAWIVTSITTTLFPGVDSLSVRIFTIHVFYLTSLATIWIYTFFFVIYLYVKRIEVSYTDPRHYVPVSVIVPTYNEEEYVGACIRSIMEQDYPKDMYEVIVVDDGSDDTTAIILRHLAEKYSNMRVIIHYENMGKAKALEDGVRAARGDVIVFVDADTMLGRRDALRLLVNALYSQSELGAVSGRIRVGGCKATLVEKLQELEFAHSFDIGRRVMSFMGWHIVLPGSFSAFKASLLKTLRELPSDTLTEDFDLSLMSVKRGFKTLHEQRALAYTIPLDSLGKLYRQRLRWYYGGLQVLSKHRILLLNIRLYGMVGLMSFLYTLLVEYALPFIQIAGFMLLPTMMAFQSLTGYSLWGITLPLLPLVVAYLLLVLFQPLAGYFISVYVLCREENKSILRSLPIALAYYTFYNMFLAVAKVDATLRHMGEMVVRWR